MGHGFLCESLHRQRTFPAHAYEQFNPECSKYYELAIPHAIRDTQQSPLCRVYPICFPAPIPSTPGCFFSTRLAAKRC